MIKEISEEYFTDSMGGVTFPKLSLSSENGDIYVETFIPLDSMGRYRVKFDAVIRNPQNIDYLELMKQIDCMMPDINQIKNKYIKYGIAGFEDNLVYEIN